MFELLDFERIEAIAGKTGLPLVLHGGSGLQDDDFRTAVQKGICKVNIFTDLDKAGKQGVERGLQEGAATMMGLIPYEIAAMKEVAWRFVSGQWSEEGFARLDDAAVSRAIESIRGLGPWSAMSVLIFALKRPDIFPLDDFGVRQALVNLYFSDENVISVGRSGAKSRVKLLANVWAPYRTVATWFLWRSLENTPLEKESE